MTEPTEEDDDDDDSDGASTDSEKGDSDRFYHFEVAKTKDQEENVLPSERDSWYADRI
jgi:hypothetical protein